MYYVVCDEKNSFFQTKIPKEWGRTMAISYEREIFFMNVLGQGHAWSARVSHQLCWARLVLMRKSEAANRLGIRQEDLKECPVILLLYDHEGKEVGFIVVYIDNVMVACKEAQMARMWKERIESNARTMGKVALKHGNAFLYLDGEVEFLGVDYKWDENEKEIQWAWASSKQEAWVTKTQRLVRAMTWTPREITSWVGTLMWVTRIAVKPLFTIEDEIELATKAQHLADKYKEDGKWDHILTELEMKTMWNTLEIIRETLRTQGNFKTNPQAVHKGKVKIGGLPTIWIAVDAAKTEGRGVVFLNARGEAMTRLWIKNTEEEEQMCAFVLETKVILEAVERINLKDLGAPEQPFMERATADEVPETPEIKEKQIIRVVSDCVGAIICVIKGYSRNKKAREYIRKLYQLLDKYGHILELRWVRGVGQVADYASRGFASRNGRKPDETEKENETRRKESWEALNKEMKLPRPVGRFFKGVDHEMTDKK